MVKTFEEYCATLESQETLEEGKIKNIAVATVLGAATMFTNYELDKFLKIDFNKSRTEQVQDLIAHADTVSVDEQEPEKNEPKMTIEVSKGVKDYYPSDEILEYIKQAEGWHEGWKNDGKGNPTTGWGFKITKKLKKRFPRGMSKKQADKYFAEEAIPERVELFKKAVPNINSYSQKQLDALFDLFYNIGYRKFTEESPNLQLALRELNPEEIIKQMDHDYDNPDLPGIKIRRDFERDLFLQDVVMS